jgi:7,8-dihydropterin-6-yl-methyl-4-(beta-D-ribofuranosyl)aminobenzene 5'-phosphate synthase
MNGSVAALKDVNRVEILTLVDNYVDLLLGNTDVVTRPSREGVKEISTDTFLAEHGLSLLVTVYAGEKRHTILFDTGYTQIGVSHNMAKLGIDADRIEAIVLSHGHMDHTGSLHILLEKIGRPIPLVVHPDAFLFPRYLEGDNGEKRRFPRTLVKADLEDRDVAVLARRTPTCLADDTVMVTGEVERVTEFEKGLPNAFAERNGKIEKDRILDDQSLVINLKEKGLVVISGCSHAGIINTVLYARKITGIDKIHGIIGGFHLSGAAFEAIIEETIKELQRMNPQVLVPMHCTGWKAIQRFSQEFPASFSLSSVGSEIVLS